MYERNQIFANRADAGRQLAERLGAKTLEWPVVLALPRGGVPVGFEVAKTLQAPLDVLLVRKIGAPGHEEFALGAVVEADTPIVVVNPDVPARYAAHIREEAQRQAAEIDERRQAYRGGAPMISLRGRTAIVVDDGIATGASFRAALEALRQTDAAKIVAAIPVAPDDSLAAVEALSDEVVCLATPEPFYAVGLHYGDFSQTTDEEVVTLLRRARQWSEQLDSNQRPPRPERGALPG